MASTSPPSYRRLRDGLYNPEKAAPTDVERVAAIQLEASTGIEDGEAWRELRDDVLIYASRVLRKLILNGEVWPLRRRLGGAAATDLRSPIDGIDRDDAHDIAMDTVLAALPILRAQLVAGRWDHTRETSIRTWMVNLCILRLAGPWRAWRKSRPERTPDNIDALRDADHGPEAIIFTIEYERSIEVLDDELMEAVVRLDCAGLTDVEIGEALVRSTKSIEYQLRKARGAMRRRARLELDRDRRTGAA